MTLKLKKHNYVFTGARFLHVNCRSLMELDNTLIRLYDFIVINMERDVNKESIQWFLRWIKVGV